MDRVAIGHDAGAVAVSVLIREDCIARPHRRRKHKVQMICIKPSARKARNASPLYLR